MIMKELSSQSSLFHLSQNTNPIAEIKSSSHGSYISVAIEIETLEACGSAPPTAQNRSKRPLNKKIVSLIHQRPQRPNKKSTIS